MPVVLNRRQGKSVKAWQNKLTRYPNFCARFYSNTLLLFFLTELFYHFNFPSAMNNTYSDLVQQTFNFPQEDFKVKDEYLQYNGLDVKSLIDKYGTPLKLTYLPKIGMQINKAKKMFAAAFKKHKYEGKYNYCYCTKSSHFSFVVEEALKYDINLETSYAYDIDIIKKLYAKKKITKDIFIICNGYKQKPYTARNSSVLSSIGTTFLKPLFSKPAMRAV